jgi:hypothetical protein
VAFSTSASSGDPAGGVGGHCPDEPLYEKPAYRFSFAPEVYCLAFLVGIPEKLLIYQVGKLVGIYGMTRIAGCRREYRYGFTIVCQDTGNFLE